MLTRILTAAALATALATTAYAADRSSSSPPTDLNNGNNANSNTQTAQNLPQEIRAKLREDGFSDVKVVPGSFIVSAKDKRGEPVTMVIGPNSMMMVTQVTNGMGNSTSQTNSRK